MTIVIPGFPVALAASLYLASAFWGHFRLLLTSLAGIVVFGLLYAIGMELAAYECGPLADDLLIRADARLGVNVVAICGWFVECPILMRLMEIAYFSVIPQTILCIAYLGFQNDPKLVLFFKRFVIGAVITLAVFYLLPARGNYEHLPRSMESTADRFDELRSGGSLVLNPVQAKGIITFPSFHTVWGVLLIAAFWSTPLRGVATAANLMMIASTIPIGCHYFVDVLAGSLLGVVLLRIK